MPQTREITQPVAYARGSDFAELVSRCRDADQRAIAELVRLYGPLIRFWVRSRARGVDEESVCQSVFKSLFLRMPGGKYELHTSTHLEKLLSSMVRNKVIDRLRKKQLPTAANSPAALDRMIDPAPSPEEVAVAQDLRERLMQLLAPGAQQILKMRLDGSDFDEIGLALGVSAACVRMRLLRAMRIAADRLGLQIETKHVRCRQYRGRAKPHRPSPGGIPRSLAVR